ncbi:MAG: hypothetical protein ABI459_06180, partial [Deltaproteobacteria bacterium]
QPKIHHDWGIMMNWLEIESKWRLMTCRAQGTKPSVLQSAVLAKLTGEPTLKDANQPTDIANDVQSATSMTTLRAF